MTPITIVLHVQQTTVLKTETFKLILILKKTKNGDIQTIQRNHSL